LPAISAFYMIGSKGSNHGLMLTVEIFCTSHS